MFFLWPPSSGSLIQSYNDAMSTKVFRPRRNQIHSLLQSIIPENTHYSLSQLRFGKKLLHFGITQSYHTLLAVAFLRFGKNIISEIMITKKKRKFFFLWFTSAPQQSRKTNLYVSAPYIAYIHRAVELFFLSFTLRLARFSLHSLPIREPLYTYV